MGGGGGEGDICFFYYYYFMNKYMIIQHCAKFHDENNIFGIDFAENVDFILIPLGLSAAKSMFFGRNQPIKISLGGISRIFIYFMNKYMFMQQYAKFHDEKKVLLGFILEKI